MGLLFPLDHDRGLVGSYPRHFGRGRSPSRSVSTQPGCILYSLGRTAFGSWDIKKEGRATEQEPTRHEKKGSPSVTHHHETILADDIPRARKPQTERENETDRRESMGRGG